MKRESAIKAIREAKKDAGLLTEFKSDTLVQIDALWRINRLISGWLDLALANLNAESEEGN